jgi:hypothetical protein
MTQNNSINAPAPFAPTKGGTGLTTYTTGDTLYASASNVLSALPIGTTGQVLSIVSGVPSWQNASPGIVLLTSITASSSGTISFTSFVNAAYDKYILRIENIIPATNNTSLKMLFSTDNGATYLGSNYAWSQGYNTSGAVAGANGSSSDSSFQIQDAMNNGKSANFEIEFYDLNDATNLPMYNSQGFIFDNGGTVGSSLRGGGGFASATQVNAIRLQMSSGNITSGTFKLYGVPVTIGGVAGSSGAVTNVNGTANRITSTGGTTPQIDISVAYVGQTSITTLGTITTGTWTGTTIAATSGGTGQSTYAAGDTLYASATNTLSKLSIGTFGAQQRINSSTLPSWISPSSTQIFYNDFENFENGPWSNDSIDGGGISRNTNAVANHPGIWNLGTGGASDGAQNVHLMEKSMTLDGGQILIEWEVQLPALSNGTDRFITRIGVMDNFLPAESSNAVYFRYTDNVNSGNWVLVARNGGSETATNSSTPVTTGWTRLSILIVPTTPLATFYVGGISVGTVASNIPTSNPVGLQAQIAKTVGTNGQSMNVDYGYIYNQLASAR